MDAARPQPEEDDRQQQHAEIAAGAVAQRRDDAVAAADHRRAGTDNGCHFTRLHRKGNIGNGRHFCPRIAKGYILKFNMTLLSSFSIMALAGSLISAQSQVLH